MGKRILNIYDKIRDDLYTIYIYIRCIGWVFYNLPKMYKILINTVDETWDDEIEYWDEIEEEEYWKGVERKVIEKLKPIIINYRDNLFIKHPNYEFKRNLNNKINNSK